MITMNVILLSHLQGCIKYDHFYFKIGDASVENSLFTFTVSYSLQTQSSIQEERHHANLI